MGPSLVSRFTKVELEGVTGKKAVNSGAMTVKNNQKDQRCQISMRGSR
jgi:hypothetical protein